MGERGQPVAGEAKDFKSIARPVAGWWEGLYHVAREVQGGQVAKLCDVLGYLSNPVVAEV